MKSWFWTVSAILVSLWVGYNFGHKQGLRDAPETIAAKAERERLLDRAHLENLEKEFEAKERRMAADGVQDPYLTCEDFVAEIEEAILWHQSDESYRDEYEAGNGSGWRWQE